MPKLKNQLPKLCKMGNYAVVNFQKKKTVLGKWDTSEARQAYARFITEIQNNPLSPIGVIRPTTTNCRGGLVSELAAYYVALRITNYEL